MLYEVITAIIARKAFTLGVPSDSQVKEADYMGIATGSKVDKFAEAGWTAVKSDLVDAPYAADVMTSYSIHYTKLYELFSQIRLLSLSSLIEDRQDKKLAFFPVVE